MDPVTMSALLSSLGLGGGGGAASMGGAAGASQGGAMGGMMGAGGGGMQDMAPKGVMGGLQGILAGASALKRPNRAAIPFSGQPGVSYGNEKPLQAPQQDLHALAQQLLASRGGGAS